MRRLLQIILLALVIGWLLALMGVEPMTSVYRDHGIPSTIAEVVTGASSGWRWLLTFFDQHPVVGLVVLPGVALGVLVWR